MRHLSMYFEVRVEACWGVRDKLEIGVNFGVISRMHNCRAAQNFDGSNYKMTLVDVYKIRTGIVLLT